jgi:hypothetical protein
MLNNYTVIRRFIELCNELYIIGEEDGYVNGTGECWPIDQDNPEKRKKIKQIYNLMKGKENENSNK